MLPRGTLPDRVSPSRPSDTAFPTPLNAPIAGEWTGQREITVTVGLYPDVAAAAENGTACTTSESSCIALLDGGVRTEALAVLSASGSTPVLGPDRPPEVSATLVAPQVMLNRFLSEVAPACGPPSTNFERQSEEEGCVKPVRTLCPVVRDDQK